MTSPELVQRIEAARRAVRAQTALLHREFGRVESRLKSDGTRVTAVDVAISENIFRELAAQFPDDQYFSEELADAGAPIEAKARFSWMLDPIDGTNNFILGIPHCAIALAVLEHGEPVYGVVYDLSRQSMVHGGPGFGLWEGERVPVQPVRAEHETLVGFHRPSDKALLPAANAIMSHYKIRSLGSATLHLAYVATGLLDGVVDFNVKIWDLAAAIPLCRAAGAEVRFINGPHLPLRSFDLKMPRIVYVAARPPLCERLAGLVRG